ncbi:MAG: site-specific integrase [Candidatus Marinimicrobia bacterium]|jgi:integrase|nr:site-specific integrase [Candidatus Neomarinimicrobiota bacterium]MBT4715358.1 site-specific integrase [Candidatus Neomarinimicrobiota bacterium]
MATIAKHITEGGKKGYRLQWYDYLGNRKSKILYLPKSQVRLVGDRLDRETREIKNGLRQRPGSLKVITDKFISTSKTDNKSPQTIKRYEKVFKPFLAYFGEERALHSINSIAIEEFKAERSEKDKVSHISVNTELRHLKALFNWAVRQEYITKSPFLGVKMLKVDDPEVRFLSENEIEKLYETIEEKKNQRAWDLVTFYLQTGVRATEILEEGGFTWDSVKDDHIEIIGKGRKRRRIPLNDTLRTILNSRRKERVPFPYTYSAVSQSLSRRLFHSAGIPDANLHTLRKTAAARLIQKGVDIYRVSKFLGHSSVKVTEKHYVDLLEVDYQDMSALLEDSTKDDSKVSEARASGWGRVA